MAEKKMNGTVGKIGMRDPTRKSRTDKDGLPDPGERNAQKGNQWTYTMKFGYEDDNVGIESEVTAITTRGIEPSCPVVQYRDMILDVDVNYPASKSTIRIKDTPEMKLEPNSPILTESSRKLLASSIKKATEKLERDLEERTGVAFRRAACFQKRTSTEERTDARGDTSVEERTWFVGRTFLVPEAVPVMPLAE